MRRIIKALGILLIVFVSICGFAFLSDRNTYSTWKIETTSNTSTIAWNKFIWASDTLNGQYFEKYAMLIPIKVEGLPYNFLFQFDLGAQQTEVYEKNWESLFVKYPQLKNKITRLKSPFEFWNSQKAIKDLTLNFDCLKAFTTKCFMHRNYGDTLSISRTLNNATLHLGTIGVDLFKNKVLIIDYPKQRFAICDTLPQLLNANYVNIELDKAGRAVLTMKLKNKNYRILFDNGSSMFPLITQAKNIKEFSTTSDTDSLKISSWGKLHTVTGRFINDTFELAEYKFSHVKIYANYSGLGIDKNTDGMAGNALFWDKLIVIDFKNKKFGVR